jgi:hypothetical protein
VLYRDGPDGFIETFLGHSKRFPLDDFTGGDNEEQNNFKQGRLPEGTRPMLPVYHDETTCYANESLPCTWLFMKDGVGPKLTKKGNGKSIMIAGYLTPVDKQLLQLPVDDPTSLPRVPLSDYVQAVAEYVGLEKEDHGEAKNEEEQKHGDEVEVDQCPCGAPCGQRGMICCDGCKTWHHLTCIGLSKNDAARMNKEQTEWLCPSCAPGGISAVPIVLPAAAHDGAVPPHDGAVPPLNPRGRAKKPIVKKGFLRAGDSTVVVESGGDVWFKGPDVVTQQLEGLRIFDVVHEGHDGLWIYDNASSHGAFSEDALLVSRMRLNPSDHHSTLRMKSGWWVDPQGTRHTQTMVREGKNIGTKTALEERGLWPEGGKQNGKRFLAGCKKCANGAVDCCASTMLADQDDFIEQECALTMLVHAYNAKHGTGHVVLFLPKFHPELNPIERFWAALKRYLRKNCTYSAPGLRNMLPQALLQVPGETFGRYFRKSLRFIHAYQRGCSYALAEFAAKKYKSHRGLPSDATYELMEAALKQSKEK